jgi:hypothetical protein
MMGRMRIGTVALTLAALLLGGLTAAEAAKTKAKPKPKAKAIPRVVLGTTQLEGEPGIMGKTYTLGKDDPWNLTLNRAEYLAGRLTIGDRYWQPNAEQKLLVLHYTVHNPQKGEALMRFDVFQLTAVDAKNTNWEYLQELGAEQSGQRVDMMMKPAQKMDVYTALLVPAAGPVPKVIFKSSDERVVRYYPDQIVNGKNVCPVKPLAAPFADPKDATGATALARLPAALGVSYPMGESDVRVDGFAFSDKQINDSELEGNEHFLIITMAAKNVTQASQVLRYDTFQARTVDADGMTLEHGNGDLLALSRDARVDMSLEPGQEMRFRMYMKVPKDASLQTFTLYREDSRSYDYDIRGVK